MKARLHHRYFVPRFAMILGAWLALSLNSTAQILQPGDVIVASEIIPNSIRVYDGVSGALKTILDDPLWAPGGSGRYVRIAPDGSLWVNDPAAESMFHYDSGLLPINHFSMSGVEIYNPCPPNHIRGFTVAPDGSLYVVSQYAIYHVDSSTGEVFWCSDLGVEPVDVDIMPNGQLCVSTNPAPSVRIVDPATGVIVQSIDLIGCNVDSNFGLGAIRALPDGRILVSEPPLQRIVAIDPFSSPGSECLWSIALDANQYPYTCGIDFDRFHGRIVTLVVRDGTYWLEHFDIATGLRISSVTTNPPSGPPLPPPTNAVAMVPTTGQLTALGPANVWIGLKNSDDVGIKFDLLAEAYEGGVLVGSGHLDSAPGGSSGFNNARLDSIPVSLASGADVHTGDVLSIKLYVRNAAAGSGKNSGTARLWYDDAQANSSVGAAVDGPWTYYLRAGFAMSASVGSGPKKTLDVAAGAKGSSFKLFGTWSITVP